MVHEYYVHALREKRKERKRLLDDVRDVESAYRYIEKVKSGIRSCFKFPEASELNPRITGKIELDTLTIEKVIYESRPGCFVTANLYLPKVDGPCPAVLGTCGHDIFGKAGRSYHSYALNLSRNGFVVLIFDPVSQGERKQFLLHDHPLTPNKLCPEHNMLGNHMLLNGDSLCNWMAWDGIRSLDYLLTRPEVDPKRVGVTGHSGGGTQTSYLYALDERLTMAAPSCFVTTYLRNVENEEVQDSEQYPPGFLAGELEMADFFISRAPKPLLLISQENDFFDPRGFIESYEEIKKFYELLEHSDKLSFHMGKEDHGYHRPAREAMVTFFSEQCEKELPIKNEDGMELVDAEQLNCLASGQIQKSDLPHLPVYHWTQSFLVSNINNGKERNLKEQVKRVLGLKDLDKNPPEYRKLKPHYELNLDCCLNRYALETERNIQAIVSSPDENEWLRVDSCENAELIVSHMGALQEMSEKGFEYSTTEKRVFYIDVRGIGASLPLTCSMMDFFHPYDGDYLYGNLGLMMNTSYLGGKVLDVLQCINWLRDAGYKNIHLKGRGLGSLSALFAGFLDKSIEKISLENALLSYRDITNSPAYKWPMSHLLFDVLSHFDLPDLYLEIGAERLTIKDPWNASMERWDYEAGYKRTKELGLFDLVQFIDMNLRYV